MDDWQETHLTTRHIHNRTGTRNNQRGSKPGSNSTSTFDVARTFGTYDVKCPAADRLSGLNSTSGSGTSKSKPKSKGGSKTQAQAESTSKLEIYTLNEGRNAVVGEIMLGGGAVNGTVILAGSRKVLEGVVRGFEKDGEEGENGEGDEVGADGERVKGGSESVGKVEKDQDGEEGDVDDHEDDDEDEETSDEEEDDKDEDEDDNDTATDQRVREFEKNSFRSPKFWIRWQGQVPAPDGTTTDEDETSIPNGDGKPAKFETVTDAGYIVFSGNQCDRFQGTISCEALGWKNVKMSGRKVKSQSARDFKVNWAAT